ncbi:MAG: type Z 30S ribosomal protein S14 [Patescibacteria group bacterium]|nr:type Z 30S ribosomal protein S14 [Patescibacteria group bacterium]MDP4030768.1 type Z 30S ribosomal protein S14 [Candidatus Beckwithbacteria bacterium]MDZ4228688.1 type Z 30S ribosomal protein S14 [Patescibacteria group bacterium]
MAKVKFWVKQNQTAKFTTRQRNRCRLCGRPRGFMRFFGICRLCFRNLAAKGELPGVTKASW